MPREPRVRLVDGNGNTVGVFYEQSASGPVALRHESSTEELALDGDGLSVSAVDTDQVTSRSLPTWRVYNDGSEVVAVDETDTEIARGSDAATVWQAALDQANTQFDPQEKFEPVAQIEAGQLEFSLSSPITVKDGAVISTATFDASGLASAGVTIGGPDDGATHGAVGAHDITIRDAGDRAFRIRDVTHCQFSRLHAENATAEGFLIQSSLGNEFSKCHARGCGDTGWRFSDGGNTGFGCNANCFVNIRAHDNAGDGIELDGNPRSNLFLAPVAESNSAFGIQVVASGGSDSANVFVAPWVESNDNVGFSDDATKTTIFGGTYSDNESGGNQRGLRLRGDETGLYGPIRGQDGFVFGAGVDKEAWGISPGKLQNDAGTRTRWNGIIGGGPLGGVDLSSTTGAATGEVARSDGTSAADADVLAVFDGTNWRYPDSTATVTPS